MILQTMENKSEVENRHHILPAAAPETGIKRGENETYRGGIRS
jgi:hypothetical protein